MSKMIYAPAGLLSFLTPPPTTVEVLEHGEHTSRIRQTLSENCIINIARKNAGKPPVLEIETEVLTEFLQPIQ